MGGGVECSTIETQDCAKFLLLYLIMVSSKKDDERIQRYQICTKDKSLTVHFLTMDVFERQLLRYVKFFVNNSYETFFILR